MASDDFDDAIKDTITKLMEDIVIPWFEKCITKYSQDRFHALLGCNWDMYRDWQDHHYKEYWAWVNKAKRIRRFLRWDSSRFVVHIEYMLYKHGWILYQSERDYLYRLVERVREDIYS